MRELTPEMLGEMTGYRKLPERRSVTDTVTAVGSPLTDPEGVKQGKYSYSQTDNILHSMSREEYDQVMKEFAEWAKMSDDEIEKMLGTMSSTTPVKESHPMTRREELETKGVSQLMAERFAKGVPRGAYSNNSFEKGGQPLTPFINKEDVASYYADGAGDQAYIVAESSGASSDEANKFALDRAESTYNEAIKSPITAMNAAGNKQGALKKDAVRDSQIQNKIANQRSDWHQGQPAAKKTYGSSVEYFNEFIAPYLDRVKAGEITASDAIKEAGRDFEDFLNQMYDEALSGSRE